MGTEAGPQKIRAWGPGLEGGVVGKPADFVAESIGTDVGVLGNLVSAHICISNAINCSNSLFGMDYVMTLSSCVFH